MLAHSSVMLRGGKLGRTCIVQQQKGAERLAMVVVGEKGADRKTVPHPVGVGITVDTDKVFH
jgi:hypothetical protein